jgi:hypothetical protein
MKKRNNFFSSMFSGANGRISSKRVLGTFILLVLLIVIVISVFRDVQAVWLGEAIMTMMIGAFSLLGIGVLEKRFKDPIPEGEDFCDSDPGDAGESGI